MYKNMNIIQKIGSGGISDVFKINNNGSYFAFKTLKYTCVYNKIAKTRIKKEYKILKNIKHKNIVKVYSWVTIENKEGILMEFIEGETLDGNINDFIFNRLMSVIIFLQNLSPSVIHNDISGKNIITDNNEVKLIDFSSSFFINEERVDVTKEKHLIHMDNTLRIDKIALIKMRKDK
jgi:serine/threonine protein kinase